MTARERDDSAPRTRWLPWVATTVVLMVVAAALGAAIAAVRYEARLGVMARELSAMHARLRATDGARPDPLPASRVLLELLRDPATQIVALRGPRATGRVVWNAVQGGQLIVAHVPPPPPGGRYALWIVTAGASQAIGRVVTDDAGHGSLTIPPPTNRRPVEGFTITLEPDGTAAPTGPTVLSSR